MKLEFTVGSETYKVPDFIDVATFEKAIVWNLDDLRNLKPFVATIVGCPLSAVTVIDEDVLAFITGVCLQRIQLQNAIAHPEIEGDTLIDLDTLTFGQFIDLDTLISGGAGENLSKIISILYSSTQSKVNKWPVADVWGALQQVAELRSNIYKEYDEFFELSDDVQDEDGPAPNIQLMWWEAIMALTGDDFLKIHQVVERPYKEALNYLTWKKARVQKEKLQQLKQKNDIQRRTR
tara:strand:+ start:120 stop:824 length:705 start_codon:yes stop_codon:yes gene_type:complete